MVGSIPADGLANGKVHGGQATDRVAGRREDCRRNVRRGRLAVGTSDTNADQTARGEVVERGRETGERQVGIGYDDVGQVQPERWLCSLTHYCHRPPVEGVMDIGVAIMVATRQSHEQIAGLYPSAVESDTCYFDRQVAVMGRRRRRFQQAPNFFISAASSVVRTRPLGRWFVTILAHVGSVAGMTGRQAGPTRSPYASPADGVAATL